MGVTGLTPWKMGHENDSPRENHLCVYSQYLFKDIYNCCAYPFRGEARFIAAKHTLLLKSIFKAEKLKIGITYCYQIRLPLVQMAKGLRLSVGSH